MASYFRRRRSNICRGVILFFAVMGTTGVNAVDISLPDCEKPIRPAEFKNIEAANRFWRTAETYQKCLVAYAASQKTLSDAHGKAANDAIGQWNAFVAENSRKNAEERSSKSDASLIKEKK
jgi:hypothetical protein